MQRRGITAFGAALVAGAWLASSPGLAAEPPIETVAERQAVAPQVDHHQHLVSPAGAELLNNPPGLTIELPKPMDLTLAHREEFWNNPSALAGILTPDAIAFSDLGPKWITGAEEAANFLGSRFAAPFHLTPTSFTMQAGTAHVAGYFSRTEGDLTRHIGHFYLALREDPGGQWKIAVERSTFPGPQRQEPITAEELVTMLDAAGIRRAVVLSDAYWFDSPGSALKPQETRAMVRAENDWTATQVVRFPQRLTGFCSFNPLADHALDELARCARNPHLKGLKLHFGMSGIQLDDPQHVSTVRKVLSVANRMGMPVVVHLRGGPSYGAEHARIFLDQLLPAAPDVPVQIAHLWGGESFSPEALAVLAEAVAGSHPATGKLYFDLADVALVAGASEQALSEMVMRMRQIGLDRILYGSDAAMAGHPTPGEAWLQFRSKMPLSAEEFLQISRNRAPYL